MSFNLERLLYLREKDTPLDRLGDATHKLFDWIYTERLAEFTQIEGKENIPHPPFVAAYAPHTGIEIFAINTAFENTPIVWITKMEGYSSLPKILQTGHFIPIHRHEMDVRAIRSANKVLQSGGVIASALEGTRGDEKKVDRSTITLEQRLPLQPAQPGLVYLALKNKVPILPVTIWGPENEQLFPVPEVIVDELGKLGLAVAVLKATLAGKGSKPEVHIRISRPYEEHLRDPRFEERIDSNYLSEHAHNIMTTCIIPQLPPKWPLGYYEGWK